MKDKKQKAFYRAKRIDIGGILEDLLDAGDDVWEANKDSLRELDIRNDIRKGKRAVDELESAIKTWIEELEAISDAGEQIRKRANSPLR